jgi:hypothetical protein
MLFLFANSSSPEVNSFGAPQISKTRYHFTNSKTLSLCFLNYLQQKNELWLVFSCCAKFNQCYVPVVTHKHCLYKDDTSEELSNDKNEDNYCVQRTLLYSCFLECKYVAANKFYRNALVLVVCADF